MLIFPGSGSAPALSLLLFSPLSPSLSHFFMAALELLSGLQCSNNHLIIINNHGNRMEINHSTSVYPHGNGAKTNKPYPQCLFLEIRHPAKFPTKQTGNSNCLAQPVAPMERARMFCHGWMIPRVQVIRGQTFSGILLGLWVCFTLRLLSR